MKLVFFVLATIVILVFGSFGITSYIEKEKRATRLSWLIAVIGGGVLMLIPQFGDETMGIALLLLGIILLVLSVLTLLPVGRNWAGNDVPSKRFDEHDIMFARARLLPGSLNYEAYYQMRPENKKVDDLTRSKPGLLSPNSKLANEYLFASPEASFTLTEVMGEMVDGKPADRKLTLPIEMMTAYVKGLAKFYGSLNVGITFLHPYHLYSNIGRGSGVYGAEIPVEHNFAIAFTVEMAHEMVATNPNPPGAMETAKQYVEAGRIAVRWQKPFARWATRRAPISMGTTA